MVSLFSLSQETQRYLRSLIGLAQNGLGGLLDNVLLGHGRSLGGEVGIADPASRGADVFGNVALVPDGGFETVLHSTQLGTLAVDGGDKFIDVTQRILGCFGRGYIERGYRNFKLVGRGLPIEMVKESYLYYLVKENDREYIRRKLDDTLARLTGKR